MVFFYSMASTEIATAAIQHGARLITHLFNAMPQLHHRDPAIIGLLGASPHALSPTPISVHLPCDLNEPLLQSVSSALENVQRFPPSHLMSEAFDHTRTPPVGAISRSSPKMTRKVSRPALHLEKGQIADMAFERPFYGIIVDGIHCHPNSVRVCDDSLAFPPSKVDLSVLAGLFISSRWMRPYYGWCVLSESSC